MLVEPRRLKLASAIAAAVALAVEAGKAQDTLLTIDGFNSSTGNPLSVTMAGDANGDGHPDVLVGNPSYTKPGAQCCCHGRFGLYSGTDAALLFDDYGYKCALETGSSVSAAGDQNADGVPDYFVSTNDAPAALLYSGSDGALLWIFTEPPPKGDPVLAHLGDVDGDGIDELAIGAHWSVQPGGGQVWIYKGGQFSVLHALTGDSTTYGFGAAIAPGGDFDRDGAPDLIVGAPLPPSGVAGRVQVFSGASGALLLTLPGEAPLSGGFGYRVADAGDTDADGWPDVLVGLHADYSPQKLGKVRLYSGRDGSLLLGFQPLDGYPYYFGDGLCGVGDVDLDAHDDIAIGDRYHGLISDDGIVRIYSGRTGAVIKSIEGDSWDGLGIALAPAGDVNGDGFRDLVAAGADSVWLFSGRIHPDPGPWPLTEMPGDVAGEEFGSAVDRAGDLDGDGSADVVAGAPASDAGGPDSGAVRVLSGKDGHVLLDVAGSIGSRLGSSVAAAGDVDGDGHPDVLAGAPLGSFGGQATGTALVLSGSDGSTLREWHGEAAGDAFGTAVSGAGDVDGDGSPDLAIGAPYRSALKPNAGAVYVFSGSTGGLIRQIEGQTGQAKMGRALAPMGDFDADGRPDLIAGAPGEKLSGDQVGAVHILSGASGAALLTVLGLDPGGAFGQAVAPAGDFDLDGRPDILVGSPAESTGPLDPTNGAVRILSGVDGSILYEEKATEQTTPLGLAVAGGEDLDRDGRPEFLVGRPTPVGGLAGAVEVHSGLDGGLLTVLSAGVAGDQFGIDSALADVDGDGATDVVIGASVLAGPGEVVAFAFVRNWNPFPGGLAGTAGLPVLSGSGVLVPGAAMGVHLAAAAPSAPAMMVIGLETHFLFFKGGVLVPTVDFATAFACDIDGEADFTSVWPSGWPPGMSFYLQAWIDDAAAAHGYAGSNALQGTPY